MSRIATIITLEELKEKLKIYLYPDENANEEFPYSLPSKVYKDINKIQFDFENYFLGNAAENFAEYPSDNTPSMDYPCGFEVLKNGLPVLFMVAGGDWEFPVCFCIYWDGKELRGYVPTNGNIYHKKLKCAYGNDGAEVEDEFDEAFKSANASKIREDIINRIQIKA